MEPNAPSKIEILARYRSLQSQAMRLLVTSNAQKSGGQLQGAAQSLHELVDVLQQQLEVVEVNNQHFPDTPFDRQPIVEPLLDALLMQADVIEALGQWKQAEAARDEATRLSERFLPATAIAERRRQRAQSLLAQSRYPEALVSLHQALDEFRQGGNVLQMASVTQNIAEVLEWLGDNARALIEAGAAAQIIGAILEERQPSERDIADALLAGQWDLAAQRAKLLQVWLGLEQIIARVNRRLGNFDEAEVHLRRVLPVAPPDALPALEVQFVPILIGRGEHERALREIERLEPSFTDLMRPKLGVLQSWKAEVLLALNRPAEALPVAEFALRDLDAYRDTDSLWKAQWRLGQALSGVGREREALTVLVEAARTVDGLRKAPLGYRLDSTYMQDKLPLFEAAIALACRLAEPEIGCTLIELVKSRALTATLNIPRDDAQSNGELEGRVDALSRDLDGLEYRAYRDGWNEETERRRNELLTERATVLERIRFSDPRWRSLSFPPAFELHKLLAVLAARRQSALTLFYSSGEVTAVLLQNGSGSVRSLAVRSETREALEAYRANLRARDFRPERFDPAAFSAPTADRLVPTEMLQSAVQSDSLLVVPHGPLHLLPWAGLQFRGGRLFEHCAVGVLPNLTCALALEMNPSPAPKVALIGAPDYGWGAGLPDLAYTHAELATVAEIYSASRIVNAPLEGRSASQAGFRQLMQEERGAKGSILHIACHGQFEPGEPMNSGLLLSDGRLDAAEIARTRLPYDEVILSACSSGYRPTEVQGTTLAGDDVLGLPGAFLEAGARSVLVSIPEARDDATLALMTLYHEERAGGRPPLLCLRDAQRSMLRNALHPPFLWIGFTLYGCQ